MVLNSFANVMTIVGGVLSTGLSLDKVINRFRRQPSTPTSSLEPVRVFKVAVGNFLDLDGSLQTLTSALEKLRAQNKIEMVTNALGQMVFLGCLNIKIGQQAIAELKKIGSGLEQIAATMTAQASFGDSFPQHVYDFVEAEMRLFGYEGKQTALSSFLKRLFNVLVGLWSEDKKEMHYFWVYSPGTDWHPKFRKLLRDKPLAENFCGFTHDLDWLCAALVQTYRPKLGPEARFHILIPSLGPLCIADPLRFPAEIGKCTVKGELNNAGHPYVWMCLDGIIEAMPVNEDVMSDDEGVSNNDKDIFDDEEAACNAEEGFHTITEHIFDVNEDLCVEGIGLIPVPNKDFQRELATVGAAFGSLATYGGATAVLITLCPPIGVVAVFGWPFFGSSVITAVDDADCWKVNIRTLGSHMMLNENYG